MGHAWSRIRGSSNVPRYKKEASRLQQSDPHLYSTLKTLVCGDVDWKVMGTGCIVFSSDNVTAPTAAVGTDALGGSEAAANTSEEGPSGDGPSSNVADYAYPFENLVFEGGGIKGVIYCGALTCLEEAGIRATRFAGTSVGAMMAALLAVRMPVKAIKELMTFNFSSILEDNSYGMLSLLPNLLRTFGWNPGQRFLGFFGDVLLQCCGNADITFRQVYQRYGTELCIVSVNINQQTVDYFHVKTTPDVAVRMAVRMSMSIPGYFAAVPHENPDGNTDYYVDGGLACNYPVHVFDGWWLSLKPEDSFFRRLRPLSDIPRLMDKRERFGSFNDKTLGLLVFANGDNQVHEVELQRRLFNIVVAPPNTALFRKKQELLYSDPDKAIIHAALSRAADKFFEALQGVDGGGNGNQVITRDAFKSVFDNLKSHTGEAGDVFTEADATLLFGENYDANKIFDSIDINRDDSIDLPELVRLLDHSVAMSQRFVGHGRMDVTGLLQFGRALLETLEMQASSVYLTGGDLERTVGLDTGYVGTTDFALEEADVNYLEKKGYAIARAFLLDYAAKHNLSKKQL